MTKAEADATAEALTALKASAEAKTCSAWPEEIAAL